MKKIIKASKIKYCILVCVILINSLFCLSVNAEDFNGEDFYSEIEFNGDDAEYQELIHMLFSKLVYDYLDGYEGNTVTEYIEDNNDLYAGEIWEDSGITYKSLYNTFIGQWQIYKIYNRNDITGFYGVAFKNENQVILSFRGSDMFPAQFPLNGSEDWTGTDLKFALLDELSNQFTDASDCYDNLCRILSLEKEDVNISLTGHSLGGALVCHQSLVSGVKGYSFDGACGHVIDLVFYNSYLDIDDFSGVDNMNFCNYTDELGYVVADLIQHTKSESMYQIDRKTNIDEMNENTLVPRVADAGSHIIWSALGHENNTIYFNEKVVSDGEYYSYMPEDTVVFDINENIIKYTLGQIPEFSYDYEDIMGSLTGAIKNGRVLLASSEGSVLRAYDGIGVSSSFDVDSVIYGGAGSDSLYGYTSDDVLIGGCNNGENNTSNECYDILDGNLGNDIYIVDKPNFDGCITEIYDCGGEYTSIILRNMNIRKSSQIFYADGQVDVNNGEYFIDLTVNQQPENVLFYAYDKGVLRYITDLKTITADESGLSSKIVNYEYIVMLEGICDVSVVVDGEKYDFSSDEDGFCICNEADEKIKAYVCGEEDNQSIMLLLDEPYQVKLNTNKKRVNLAVGIYDFNEGVLHSKRVYNKKYSDYVISFDKEDMDDGSQGDTSWQDAIYSGFSYIYDMIK